VVDELCLALLAGAVRTAEELPVGLEAVAEDAAVAVVADRCHLLGGAFDAVEGMDRSLGVYLERHLVVVAADLAHGHGRSTPHGFLDATAAGTY